MKAQSAELESQLAKHGWKIAEVEDQALEWWADEIWRLESVWSPVGAHAYLAFLVDPQDSARGRKKGQCVWAVMVSPTRPRDWLEGPGEYTSGLRRHWKEEMPGLFEHLAMLRNRVASGGTESCEDVEIEGGRITHPEFSLRQDSARSGQKSHDEKLR